ncbi:hypothetical protein E2562_011378 [Oryza meyeriana var. granulata]|uniref:Uncharacterized protein n=1 Tax=Oryza meyeriana var. granulata TaxID=110450 RepID=A0A6G1EA11_9ORYZ|nr:hypothetical protein E2562_011378 [Oryza meyeriana var. granulata]
MTWSAVAMQANQCWTRTQSLEPTTKALPLHLWYKPNRLHLLCGLSACLLNPLCLWLLWLTQDVGLHLLWLLLLRGHLNYGDSGLPWRGQRGRKAHQSLHSRGTRRAKHLHTSGSGTDDNTPPGAVAMAEEVGVVVIVVVGTTATEATT